jgi:hypothetical protein
MSLQWTYCENNWDAPALASCWTRCACICPIISACFLCLHCLALKFLPEGTDIPWHRVIASSGTISLRGPGTTGADRQRQALEAEDVVVSAPGLGRGLMRVNLAQYGWFPDPAEFEFEDDDDDAA